MDNESTNIVAKALAESLNTQTESTDDFEYKNTGTLEDGHEISKTKTATAAKNQDKDVLNKHVHDPPIAMKAIAIVDSALLGDVACDESFAPDSMTENKAYGTYDGNGEYKDSPPQLKDVSDAKANMTIEGPIKVALDTIVEESDDAAVEVEDCCAGNIESLGSLYYDSNMETKMAINKIVPIQTKESDDVGYEDSADTRGNTEGKPTDEAPEDGFATGRTSFFVELPDLSSFPKNGEWNQLKDVVSETKMAINKIVPIQTKESDDLGYGDSAATRGNTEGIPIDEAPEDGFATDRTSLPVELKDLSFLKNYKWTEGNEGELCNVYFRMGYFNGLRASLNTTNADRKEN